MYLANVTFADIAYAVNYLARKQLDPTKDDWMEVKKVLRYLRSGTEIGIEFLPTLKIWKLIQTQASETARAQKPQKDK